MCVLCSDACDLTLDPNTAHTRLVLSEENRKVTRVIERQSYPDHPDRFYKHPQVLCSESLTGRCYWETEWSGDYTVILVAYKEIKRKGESDDCLFGRNVKSWSLECSDQRFRVHHNHEDTVLSAARVSWKRAAVFLDESSSSLSFYSVSDTHTHLYHSDSSVSLCHIKH